MLYENVVRHDLGGSKYHQDRPNVMGLGAWGTPWWLFVGHQTRKKFGLSSSILPGGGRGGGWKNHKISHGGVGGSETSKSVSRDFWMVPKVGMT